MERARAGSSALALPSSARAQGANTSISAKPNGRHKPIPDLSHFGAPLGCKRIVVVASLTWSLVNFRFELLEAMTAAGHEVFALAPDEDPQTIARLERIGVAFERIPMARTGMNPLADLRTLMALHRIMRRLAPDIVLAYTMKPIIYGGLAARMAGVRRRFALFTGFGFLFGDGRSSPRKKLVRLLGIRLYRAALAGAEGAFAYNDADATEIERYAMLDRLTPLRMVAGSGVNLDRFLVSEPPAGPPVFLMVARLLRDKGVAEFIAAARAVRARHPLARFQLLGPFDPSPLAVTKAELCDWIEDGAVEYLGETSDVRPFLAAATVFVLPSYYREGIPRSALEALATGRPIITTDEPGCRDTVISGQNGFHVPARDATALASAMRLFLDDETLAARMGARSRKLAEEKFDVHAINRSLLEAISLTKEE